MTQRMNTSAAGLSPAERIVAGGLLLLIVAVCWFWLGGGGKSEATIPPATQPLNVLDMEPVSHDGRMAESSDAGSVPATLSTTVPTAFDNVDPILLPID